MSHSRPRFHRRWSCFSRLSLRLLFRDRDGILFAERHPYRPIESAARGFRGGAGEADGESAPPAERHSFGGRAGESGADHRLPVSHSEHRRAEGALPGHATLLIFTFLVFVCDLMPKLAALGNPYRFTRLGVRVLRPILPFIDPVARLLQRISEAVAEAVTPKSVQAGPFSERRRTRDAAGTRHGSGRASGGRR